MDYIVTLRKAYQSDAETTPLDSGYATAHEARTAALRKLAELDTISNHERYVAVDVYHVDGTLIQHNETLYCWEPAR